MKPLLISVGILAMIAVSAPTLVVLGYFLLIIPGLVLTAAPSVFVYLAATAALRTCLPFKSTVTATTLSLAISLFVGWAIMQPFRWQATAQYHAMLRPNVSSSDPIRLHGDVLLLWDQKRRNPTACDYLVAALLDAGNVQSVTVQSSHPGQSSDAAETVAYTIVSAEEHSGPGLYPVAPDDIIRHHPKLQRQFNAQQRRIAAKAIKADWALRLSKNERLIETQQVSAPQADWIVRLQSSTDSFRSRLRRVEISDRNGQVHYRNSYVSHSIPAPIFYFGFRAFGGGGSLSQASFEVAEHTLQTGDRSLQLESDLLGHIQSDLPSVDPQLVADLRGAVQQAVDALDASPVSLALARQYLSLFFFDATEEDYALISQVVADQRIDDIGEPLANVFSKSKVPPMMADAYAQRIAMPHTTAKEREHLARSLANMPRGTFAGANASFRSIWQNPHLYRDAAPFLACLADQPPQTATPRLLEILDESIELKPWEGRRAITTAICDAFVRLGPPASAAIPRIRELFLQRPSPITNDSKGANDWRFALARLGVAIEDLPYYDNQSADSIQRSQASIRQRMARYRGQP